MTKEQRVKYNELEKKKIRIAADKNVKMAEISKLRREINELDEKLYRVEKDQFAIINPNLFSGVSKQDIE